MKAALFSEFGGPDVVRIDDAPEPQPGAGEARVSVRASSMNHLDLWVRRGLPIEITMPHIGGSDVAGVVESVGPGVDESLVGLRVVADPSLGYAANYQEPPQGPGFPAPPFRLIGEHTDGGFAELAVVPAENLLELPEDVEFETAAAAGLVFVTAWRGLMTRARIRAGERVLVTGASGGVSTAAIQIARMAGARVHALTGGADNVERIRQLGAHHVYDRLEDDVLDRIKHDTGRRGVDVVLDSVGEALWETCLRSLAVGGRLVSYGATTGAKGVTEIRHLFWKQLSVLGSTMGTHAEFRQVMKLVFRGRLSPIIHEVMPLEDARRAHEMLEAGNVFGKLVLTP